MSKARYFSYNVDTKELKEEGLPADIPASARAAILETVQTLKTAFVYLFTSGNAQWVSISNKELAKEDLARMQAPRMITVEIVTKAIPSSLLEMLLLQELLNSCVEPSSIRCLFCKKRNCPLHI